MNKLVTALAVVLLVAADKPRDDGGKKALTGRSDRYSNIKWNGPDGLLLSESDLGAIKVTDFEMIDGGPRVPYAGRCVRDPAAPTP